jgi:hypothetical protein
MRNQVKKLFHFDSKRISLTFRFTNRKRTAYPGKHHHPHGRGVGRRSTKFIWFSKTNKEVYTTKRISGFGFNFLLSFLLKKNQRYNQELIAKTAFLYNANVGKNLPNNGRQKIPFLVLFPDLFVATLLIINPQLCPSIPRMLLVKLKNGTFKECLARWI